MTMDIEPTTWAQRPSANRGVAQAGFTLIELLVVLAIVALLVAAVPAMVRAGRPGLDARAAAIAFANDLRAARNAAIIGNDEARVSFDIAAGRYTIMPSGQARELPQGMVLHLRAPSGEVSADTAAIRFFPDGSSTGAEVRLSYRGQEHRVAAQWISGRISIDE